LFQGHNLFRDPDVKDFKGNYFDNGTLNVVLESVESASPIVRNARIVRDVELLIKNKNAELAALAAEIPVLRNEITQKRAAYEIHRTRRNGVVKTVPTVFEKSRNVVVKVKNDATMYTVACGIRFSGKRSSLSFLETQIAN
jgi:hypothetical protein